MGKNAICVIQDDSAAIRKLLNIAGDTPVTPATTEAGNQATGETSTTSKGNYGRQVSIQELFEGAKQQKVEVVDNRPQQQQKHKHQQQQQPPQQYYQPQHQQQYQGQQGERKGRGRASNRQQGQGHMSQPGYQGNQRQQNRPDVLMRSGNR